MLFRVIVMAAALAATPALAGDVKASQSCAAKLTPDGKKMYDAAAPGVKPDSDLRDVIRSAAIPLVMGGSLTVDVAQANGPAVGQCLVLLK
ncbi:MAG: hypothetical protein RL490_1627 [Pseudomonadota bacterium]|jgi:hypothetical protein